MKKEIMNRLFICIFIFSALTISGCLKCPMCENIPEQNQAETKTSQKDSPENNREQKHIFDDAITEDDFCEKHFTDADLKQSIKQMTTSLKTEKKAEAYDQRAWSNYQLGNLKVALADSNKAIELEPNHAYLYINKGEILFARKNYKEALKTFNKAHSLKDDEPMILILRGKTYLKLGEDKKALNDFTRANFMDPHLIEAYYFKGWALYNMANFTEAKECLEEAKELFKKENNKKAVAKVDKLLSKIK